MPQTVSQCTNCGAFTRRSLYHEEEYQSSVLLERLRASNFPATDEEISHVRHTILPTVSDDISSIESKIASLREVITAMKEERERLINVQKRYHNLVSESLHRALPSEIWSEIFLYTLSTPSDSNAFDASGPIWRLSHVCQKWRNIALSLHSFWSTIDLQFANAAQEGDVQRLETIIHRSCQRPLDVSLQSDYSLAPSPDPSIQQRIIDILLAESYRWQKLHLSDWGGNLNMLYAPLHNRLPRLESLSLECVQIELKEQSVFKDCPRLTKLTIEESPPVAEFPWDQIAELDLHHMDFDGGEGELRACMRMIGLCTSLEILSLPYWSWEDDDITSPYPPTTCSNVRKLATRSARVLDALTLPQLQEASLHPATDHFDVLYLFNELLVRSNSSMILTRLSLVNVPLVVLPPHSLHSILSQTHCLTFFKATVYIEDDDYPTYVVDVSDDQDDIVMVVESLATETVTFLPLLSSLDIGIHDRRMSPTLPYFRQVPSFASTIKARWNGDDKAGLARLRTCHFAVHAQHLRDDMYRESGSSVSRIFDETERSVFNALIDDGMDLIVRVTSKSIITVGDDRVVFAVPS